MKKLLSYALMLLTVGFFLTGCGGLKEPTPQMQGKLYTTVNMWEEKGKILATNYARGRLIPVNSEVVIHGYSSKLIEFSIVGEGEQKIKLINVSKFTRLDVPGLAARMFSREEADLSEFSEDVQNAILVGDVRNGMSKEAVKISRGFPPSHVTPSLDGNVWKYWQNRWVTRNVLFEDGVVSGLAGWGTGNN